MLLMFLNYFNVLILKIILKKIKNIINIYFSTKYYLKNNHNLKHKNKVSCMVGVIKQKRTKDISDDFNYLIITQNLHF